MRSLLTRFSGSFERSQYRPSLRAHGAPEPGLGAGDTIPPVTDYREELVQTLQSLPAAGFERFCQRLLRESGFQEVTITGRSGDGGIDGIGILQVNALVSFKVLFQCKKYAGSVTPSHVRDFRGAMTGRADKGIIITTGSFTSEARKEAVRDGAPPIELVDGEKLAGMLEQLELGLRPRQTFEVDFPDAAPLLTLLFAAGVGFSVTSVAVAIITAADRPTIVSMLGVGILGAAIIGHLVLIPRLGALGAATVTAVTGASGAALAIGIVHSVWRVHAYDTLCRAVVVAAPSYWAATTIATPTPLGVVVKLTLLSLAVVGAFIALGELHADDKVRLRAAFPTLFMAR